MTAAPDADRGPRDVVEFLDPDGLLDLDAVAAALVDDVVEVGSFTDEELHWLRDDGQLVADDLEAPRLGRLEPAAAEAALDAALSLLVARGDLQVVPDTDGALRPVGRHAVLRTLREQVPGVVRIRTDDRERGSAWAAAYRVDDRMLLLEVVEPGGIHHLVLATPQVATGWLASQLDPAEQATASAEPLRATSVEGLDADLDAIVARAATSTQLLVGRATPDGDQQQALTVYAGPDGVHTLQGWTTDDDGDVSLQVLGPDAVLGLAHRLLTETIRPDAVPNGSIDS